MSEAEVQALFPDIDFSAQLDQFAGIVSYLDLIKTDLPGLYSMFGEALPEEVLKIATDLDMTGAQARWDEFAANPGAITTEAIIIGLSAENQQVNVDAFISRYTEVPEGANTAALTPTGLIAYVEKYAEVTGGADVSGLTPEIAECLVAGYKELASGADVSLLKPDEIVAYVSSYAQQQGVDISALSPEGLTAFVMAYEETTGGALTTALSPDDVTAMVAKYLQAENVNLSALTPDQIEAIVTRYAEATGCDKSQLLPSFTAYITEYREAEGVSVPKPKTQVIITGYDYLAYRKVIWRCNRKYARKGNACPNRHLEEKEIRKAFVEAVNRLISRREEILSAAEAFSTMLADTSGLEQQLDRLTAGKDVILRKLTVMVHENAVKEQDQDEYQRQYQEVEGELTRLDTEMEKLKTKKADRLLRRNKLRAFMGRLRAAKQLAAFDEGMFLGLTETVRVCPDRLVFVFRDGTEVAV